MCSHYGSASTYMGCPHVNTLLSLCGPYRSISPYVRISHVNASLNMCCLYGTNSPHMPHDVGINVKKRGRLRAPKMRRCRAG